MQTVKYSLEMLTNIVIKFYNKKMKILFIYSYYEYNMNIIPDEFKCCVTGNIMDDPVICDDGYTYDKNSIENLCHMISAKTFKKITTIIPNRTLKYSIDKFKQTFTETT
jgi:hypothetical protein